MIANHDSHAANERTFLAWVRTAMAVVGFGLAAGRIGQHREDFVTEILLLVAGAIVIALAYFRMRLIRKRIDSPCEEPDGPELADLVLMALIGALFAMMALFAWNVR